ncbi:hypothetical protein OUZ56_014925 [Daphnia magna]|uniref:Uncharacterized protein n=1 Tax=Daphnia magna TaxID=35525 RepID=A0ABR0AL85_9CRUS|nr:hypothetical protein OUZ56_014925 [Daphnia magna]
MSPDRIPVRNSTHVVKFACQRLGNGNLKVNTGKINFAMFRCGQTIPVITGDRIQNLVEVKVYVVLKQAMRLPISVQLNMWILGRKAYINNR